MEICVVGCSHRTTPLEIREKLAFSPQQVRDALALWQDRYEYVEAVLLSTCNRVEVCLASEMESLPPPCDVIAFLADFHSLPVGRVVSAFYSYSMEEALRHLFAVSAGLDSMVLGEPQILSQVKQAYQWATELGTVGPILHTVFQGARRAARRVASETTIQQRRVSIPSIAVGDFAKGIFEHFGDKRVLVIGAGEMAEETLRYLREEGANRIVVTNRHRDRAEELAERWQGTVSDWQNLFQTLCEADVVISTTGAEKPIVMRDTVARVMARRPDRPLFVLDLAVPRDFEPVIAEMPGVFLYCLDDLEEVCQKNREARDRELPRALQTIDQEVDAVMGALRERAVGPFIRELRRDWEAVKEQELQRLFNKHPDLTPQARQDIRLSFDRLVNKLLHSPLSWIREYSQNNSPQELIALLRKLFRL